MMKIHKLGKEQVILSNPYSLHNYFAWPTVCRLQNGKIAVTASGFRLNHICPFGKTVISFSEDEGKTYTLPAPVIDTFLDDRDGGICPFGESGVLVTSFNNTIDFQRSKAEESAHTDYKLAYLAEVPAERERQQIGSTFRISRDCGITFGELMKSPVTSPHGPTVLSDGTILWVGRCFSADHSFRDKENFINVYALSPSGKMEYMGEIENVAGLLSCEPFAIEADDGTVICHIRVQNHHGIGERVFTIYQSESHDKGKSWSTPHQLLDNTGGAPAHILKLSDGTLISTYGVRDGFFGIRAMFSFDNGRTWDAGHTIYDNGGISNDLGYPSTVVLKDGTLLTVFYARTEPDGEAVIMQQKWSFER